MVVQQIKDQRFEHKPDDLRKLTFVDGQATPVTREADKILANMVVPTIKADGSAWLPGGTRMSLPQQLVPKQWLVFDKVRFLLRPSVMTVDSPSLRSPRSRSASM